MCLVGVISGPAIILLKKEIKKWRGSHSNIVTSKHFIQTIYLCRPLPMKPPNFLIPPLLNWHFTTSILVSFNFHRIMKLKLFLKTEFIFYKKHVKSCFCLFGLTQSVKFLKFKKVLPLDFWWVFFCKIFSFL